MSALTTSTYTHIDTDTHHTHRQKHTQASAYLTDTDIADLMRSLVLGCRQRRLFSCRQTLRVSDAVCVSDPFHMLTEVL